jgi:transcriptional regulator with XRE-family HTH domain
MSKQISRLCLIGNKIRHKIKAQGHTLESFASQVGMTTSKLGRICTGKGETIDVAAFERIAFELGVEFEALIDTKQPLHPNLTGYPHIDELLVSFCAELYNGKKGHQVLKNYVTDDYSLRYLHNSLAAPLHITDHSHSSTLAEEMALNAAEAKRHDACIVVPTLAWPYGKAAIVVHTKSTFRNTDMDKVVRNVPEGTLTRHVSTIELWSLTPRWEQVLAIPTPDVRVNRRTIGILGATTNN